MPIGKPISNTQIYIVDTYNQVVPIGVVGEICVGGMGVARGYLGRPELTNERFIENPFNSDGKLYKTGDLGRWLPDGNIEFLGRADYQVKIRGYRIELAEIENELLHHPLIKEAVIIDKQVGESKDKVLCAYYVSNESLTSTELRSYLSENLPEYMIPSYFIPLESIPLTSNDKVDRQALPSPETLLQHTEAQLIISDTEQALIKLWENVLGIKGIGINDDFFEVGGHSLNANVLIRQINDYFNIALNFAEMFSYTRLRDMAKYIESKMDTNKSNDLIVLLKDGKDTQNGVFFIHDGSCEVSGYREIVKALNINCKVWGINASKLNTYEVSSIETLAYRYIKLIESVQSSGTYHFVGWSLGGTIAYEMIRQLEDSHKEVGYFAMLDTTAPNKQLVQKNAVSLKGEKEFVKALITNTSLVKQINKCKIIEDVWKKAIETISTDINTPEQLQAFKETLPQNIAYLIPNIEQVSVSELLQYVMSIRALQQAAVTYIPRTNIKAAITYFSASNKEKTNDQQWNKYSDVEVIEALGTHRTMVKGEGAIKIAQSISSEINKRCI